MKVTIEAESQVEFDGKRQALAKALIGKPALEPRRSALIAQNEIMDYFDERFRSMLEAIKGDINEILSDSAT